MLIIKNDRATELLPREDPKGFPTQAEANGIFVTDGGDIYVTGYKLRDDTRMDNATVWKNGEKEYWREPDEFSTSYAIEVSDGKVYICGWQSMDRREAAYWIDGKMFALGQEGTCYFDMDVADGDVYTGGTHTSPHDEHASAAAVWRNGTLLYDISEPGLDCAIHGIFVK